MKNKLYFLFVICLVYLLISCNGTRPVDSYYEKKSYAYDVWYDITEMYHSANIDEKEFFELMEIFDDAFRKRFMNVSIISYEYIDFMTTNKERIEGMADTIEKIISVGIIDKSVLDPLVSSIDYNLYILGDISYCDEIDMNRKFVTYFKLLIVLGILMVTSLIYLNWRELKKRANQLINSKTHLKHIIKTQEEERTRIARELHDSLAQEIRFIGLLATKIDDKNLANEIQKKQTDCINQIRNLCYNFAPPDISAGDLPSALNTLISEFIQETGINCKLTILNELDFSPFQLDELLHFYRIIQEALSNIHKHSKATEATILFRYKLEESGKTLYKLIISDNGKGIDEQVLKSLDNKILNIKKEDGSHFGLRGMMERVSLMDGTMKIDSIPGEGTQIDVCVRR